MWIILVSLPTPSDMQHVIRSAISAVPIQGCITQIIIPVPRYQPGQIVANRNKSNADLFADRDPQQDRQIPLCAWCWPVCQGHQRNSHALHCLHLGTHQSCLLALAEQLSDCMPVMYASSPGAPMLLVKWKADTSLLASSIPGTLQFSAASSCNAQLVTS